MSEIALVVAFDNGAVMVFDDEGNQIPKYQGFYVNCWPEIIRNASDKTYYEYSSPYNRLIKITKEQFMNLNTKLFLPE